jgi:ATP-binding cassette subfamily B protein
VAQKLLTLATNHITYAVCRDLRNRVSGKLQRLPLSYTDAHTVGDTVSRVVSDVDALADGLLMSFTQLFSGILTIVATLGVMFWLNPVIAVVVVVLTPLSILVARFIATRTHRHFTEQATVRGEETGLVNELIDGARVVKEFGHADESLAEFDEGIQHINSGKMQNGVEPIGPALYNRQGCIQAFLRGDIGPYRNEIFFFCSPLKVECEHAVSLLF